MRESDLDFLNVSSGVQWCPVVARSPCCDARSGRVAVAIVCCYVEGIVSSGRCGCIGVLVVVVAVLSVVVHCCMVIVGG